MIDLSQSYKTQDGKAVSLISHKMLHGKKVYVGTVEGVKGYRHWDEDGYVFGDKDKSLNLVARETEDA